MILSRDVTGVSLQIAGCALLFENLYLVLVMFAAPLSLYFAAKPRKPSNTEVLSVLFSDTLLHYHLFAVLYTATIYVAATHN